MQSLHPLLLVGHSVISDSLQPLGLQHTLLPCPSLSPSLSIGLVMPSNHLILCRPLLLLSSIFPSIRVFPAIGHWLWISHGRSSLGHMSNQTDPQSPQPGRWGILIWLIHTTRPLEEVLSTNWLKLTESLAPEWTSFIKIQWLEELGFC